MPDRRPPTRFIFVTGGVVSALGKGITAASIGSVFGTSFSWILGAEGVSGGASVGAVACLGGTAAVFCVLVGSQAVRLNSTPTAVTQTTKREHILAVSPLDALTPKSLDETTQKSYYPPSFRVNATNDLAGNVRVTSTLPFPVYYFATNGPISITGK